MILKEFEDSRGQGSKDSIEML